MFAFVRVHGFVCVRVCVCRGGLTPTRTPYKKDSFDQSFHLCNPPLSFFSPPCPLPPHLFTPPFERSNVFNTRLFLVLVSFGYTHTHTRTHTHTHTHISGSTKVGLWVRTAACLFFQRPALPTVAFIVHCWRMDGVRREVREEEGCRWAV